MLADLTAKRIPPELKPEFWLNLTVLVHFAGRLATVTRVKQTCGYKLQRLTVTFYGFFKGVESTTDLYTLSVSF